MSRFKTTLPAALVLAIIMVMVPASVSPAGNLEVAGLCADGDCEPAPNAWCNDGELRIQHFTTP